LRIKVNGESTEVEEGSSISVFLGSLNLSAPRLAIELNGEIISKSAYDQTKLSPGDKLEIVSFVGGGQAGSASH